MSQNWGKRRFFGIGFGLFLANKRMSNSKKLTDMKTNKFLAMFITMLVMMCATANAQRGGGSSNGRGGARTEMSRGQNNSSATRSSSSVRQSSSSTRQSSVSSPSNSSSTRSSIKI